MNRHVLSVGQCSADDYRLARALQVEADAHLVRAYTADEAGRLIQQRRFDLVLVNRIIEGDGTSGPEFIAAQVALPGAPGMMLISDYPDAQIAAEANGAYAGFGKSDLGSPEVGQRLRQALHSAARAGEERTATPS